MSTLLNLYPGDAAAGAIANVVLQSTLVMALAWLVSRRMRSAPARHGVWLAALLMVLLAPVIAVGMQSLGVTLFHWPQPLVQETALAVSTQPNAIVTLRHDQEIAPAYLNADAAAAPPPGVRVADGLRAGILLALIVWLVGAAWKLLRLAHGFMALRRFKRTIEPLSLSDQRRRIAIAATDDVGLRHVPVIGVSALATGPLSVGLTAPRVVLPAALAQSMDDATLRDVLTHEFAHIARRDLLVGLLQRVAEILYWPHPLLRVLNRELAAAQEDVCDNFVLARTPAAVYARRLVAIVERLSDSPRLPMTAGMATSKSGLMRRVEGILDQQRAPLTRLRPARALAVAALFGTVALLAGCVQVKDKEHERDDDCPKPAVGATAKKPWWVRAFGPPLMTNVARAVIVKIQEEAEMRKKLEKKATLEFKDTPLDEGIAELRKLADVTIIVDPRVFINDPGPKISLKVTDATLMSTLDEMMEQSHLEYVFKDGAIFISKAEYLQDAVELRIYDVSDLIVDREGADIKTAADLIARIKKLVTPKSWNNADVSIEERAGKLVVMQRPAVHEQINRLVRAIRDRQQTMINHQIQLLDRKSAARAAKLGKAVNDVLNAAELQEVVNAGKAQVMPRLTVFDRQHASLYVAGDDVQYVAGYDPKTHAPITKTLKIGTTFEMNSVISQDRKYITVEVTPTVTDLVRMDRKKSADGNIETPVVVEHRGTSTVTIPDAATILLELPARKDHEAALFLLNSRVLEFTEEEEKL